VREFTEESVPATVVDRALDAALLAPNSSNMQTWDFHWVRSPAKKTKLVEACLNQTAACTAAELVVAVANPRKWRANNAEILRRLTAAGAAEQVLKYYGKLMPFVYGMQLLAPFKWLIFNLLGLVKPTPRRPWSARDRAEVCIKSCTLACQNLMLALRAQDFDSCPMEGFDEARVARLLSLPRGARVVMVVAIGKRTPTGIWGDRLRLGRERSVKTV
jgi:nitroreductase